jgi:hypothetical protein
MLVQKTEKFSLSASFTKSIIPPHLITNDIASSPGILKINQKLLRGVKNEG